MPCIECGFQLPGQHCCFYLSGVVAASYGCISGVFKPVYCLSTREVGLEDQVTLGSMDGWMLVVQKFPQL